MVLVEAGARVMSGLTRNPTRLPRLAGGATYYWVGTGATARTITASKASFERISLTQHKVAAATYIDYEMLMDANPGVEQIVREDFGLQLALAWDEAGLIGDSSSSTYQPDGVVTVAGTNSVAIGANGGAMTYNKMQDMVTALDEDNALRGSPKWIFHPRLRGELSKIVDGNSRPIFVDTFGQAGIMPAEGGTKQLLLNYPYLTTTTLPVNLIKGGGTDLTYLLLADWSQMLIGYWGGLAIMATNEGQTLALEDQTLIVAKRLGDIGFRHLAAFCVCSDALSTS